MATSAEWHEDYTKMSEEALNFSRAVKSVQEELEAVDWYNQRAQATTDQQLRRILEHNRDEEIEHAIMGLEYLRRMNKGWNLAGGGYDAAHEQGVRRAHAHVPLHRRRHHRDRGARYNHAGTGSPFAAKKPRLKSLDW